MTAPDTRAYVRSWEVVADWFDVENDDHVAITHSMTVNVPRVEVYPRSDGVSTYLTIVTSDCDQWMTAWRLVGVTLREIELRVVALNTPSGDGS